MVRPLQNGSSDIMNHRQVEAADINCGLVLLELFSRQQFFSFSVTHVSMKMSTVWSSAGQPQHHPRNQKACFISHKTKFPLSLAPPKLLLASACKVSYTNCKQYQPIPWHTLSPSLVLFCQEGLSECNIVPSPDSDSIWKLKKKRFSEEIAN